MPESDGTLQLSMVEIVCRCMSDRFGEEAALARLERIMPSGRSRRHVVLSECPVTGRDCPRAVAVTCPPMHNACATGRWPSPPVLTHFAQYYVQTNSSGTAGLKLRGDIPAELLTRPHLRLLDLRGQRFNYVAGAAKAIASKCLEKKGLECPGVPPDGCEAYGDEYKVSPNDRKA